MKMFMFSSRLVLYGSLITVTSSAFFFTCIKFLCVQNFEKIGSFVVQLVPRIIVHQKFYPE